MKSKDILLIGVIVFISGIVSLLVSKEVFTTKASQQQVEMVEALSSDFSQPDNRYFNATSTDPTQLITIGQNNNADPFNGNN